MTEPMKPFKYRDQECPPEYRCAQCGAHGVKLWRDYNTFAAHIELMCAKCAAPDKDVGADGKVWDEICQMRIDQLGGLVPAVPTEDGNTFWGYTSVPEDGVLWWKCLPLVDSSALQKRLDEANEIIGSFAIRIERYLRGGSQG